MLIPITKPGKISCPIGTVVGLQTFYLLNVPIGNTSQKCFPLTHKICRRLLNRELISLLSFARVEFSKFRNKVVKAGAQAIYAVAYYSAVRNIGDRWCTEERTDEASIFSHFA